MINQINWGPLLLAFVVFTGTEFSPGHAQDAPAHWSQFRGSNGDGISFAKDLPVEFDESKNVRWKTLIPDSGWSSPMIWENEIWLTTGSGGTTKEQVVAWLKKNRGKVGFQKDADPSKKRQDK